MGQAAGARDAQPIRTIDDLLEPLHSACRPRDTFLIGAEAEKIGVIEGTFAPVDYEGPNGVVAVMRALVDDHGWVVAGDGPLLALEKKFFDATLPASVTLEPGAQLELSGAPLPDVHAIDRELRAHAAELAAVSERLAERGGQRIVWLGVGFHPFAKQAELPWVPKPRYGVMRRYLPARGAYGLDMMRRTATVQANFDYENEEHAMRCLRVGMKLAPFFTAMFANSPFYEGAPFGGKSYRARVWLDVDPARQGLVPSVWKDDARFLDYVEWALDAPMFVVIRDGVAHENTGQSFRSFMRYGFSGLEATHADWVTHLNSLFPEVRLKRTLEVRGGDSLPTSLVPAPSALFAGLFYDERALSEVEELSASYTHDEALALRRAVPVSGLHAPFRGRPAGEVAQRVLDIAQGGLSRRARVFGGKDERVFLESVIASVAQLRSPADELLDACAPPQEAIELAVRQASLRICRL